MCVYLDPCPNTQCMPIGNIDLECIALMGINVPNLGLLNKFET